MSLTPEVIAKTLALRKQSAPITFTKKQQETIKEKYDHCCALCCLGVEDGVDICVVHKRASVDGGKATIDNGQILCVECNKVRYDDTPPAHMLKKIKKSITFY